MKRIGLISDTHGYLDEAVFKHFESCDEIWHGEILNDRVAAEQLSKSGQPVRGVYGNIDGYDVRSVYQEQLIFTCEEVRVLMKHIGGYPGRYERGVRELILEQPQLL